jgi:hypothetical protein
MANILATTLQSVYQISRRQYELEDAHGLLPEECPQELGNEIWMHSGARRRKVGRLDDYPESGSRTLIFHFSNMIHKDFLHRLTFIS